QVLWEGENTDGFMYGFTENYVKVRTEFDSNKVNTTESICLTAISRSGEVDVEILESVFV
ncbi:MAG: tRNA (N(6)-L-threonylcarbamoyladenosine(37)-C(2))-methylthiotransferase MtaB, partial [Flavobacteriales bacterium]